MKIMIINCHWNNHGDEAAIRSMIDELTIAYPDAEFYIQRTQGRFCNFPDMKNVKVLPPFPLGGRKHLVLDRISYITNGKINCSKSAKAFYKALNESSLVLHAPGGPSIGDLYINQENLKLLRLEMVKKRGIPYAFYAPSMGPFCNKKRNPRRLRILEGASLICLREEISCEYVKEFSRNVRPIVTLDSAFQHEFDSNTCETLFQDDIKLREFIGNGENIIGITITDLQWNDKYKDGGMTEKKIRETFEEFIKYLLASGNKILFIPQLFGDADDSEYMRSYVINDSCYVLNENYDCYFQQHIIGKLIAVIGMRYHSNIFSAKMGVPFVSVSYEQKMKGFMDKVNLSDYCIDIEELSFLMLKSKFELLMKKYEKNKAYLKSIKSDLKKQSYHTTELVCELLNGDKYSIF